MMIAQTTTASISVACQDYFREEGEGVEVIWSYIAITYLYTTYIHTSQKGEKKDEPRFWLNLAKKNEKGKGGWGGGNDTITY